MPIFACSIVVASTNLPAASRVVVGFNVVATVGSFVHHVGLRTPVHGYLGK